MHVKRRFEQLRRAELACLVNLLKMRLLTHSHGSIGILWGMHEPSPPRDTEPNHSSRVLVIVIAAIIVIAFAAFLVIRPRPGGTDSSGGGHSSPTTTQQ